MKKAKKVKQFKSWSSSRQRLAALAVLLVVVVAGYFTYKATFASSVLPPIVVNKCKITGKVAPNAQILLDIHTGPNHGGQDTLTANSLGFFSWNYTQGAQTATVYVYVNGDLKTHGKMGPC